MTTRTHTKTAENFGATFQDTFTDDAAPAAGDNIQNTLDALADEARKALAGVSEGNSRSVNGWVAYGKALNAGRELFPEDDKGFGQWVLLCQVGTVDVSRHERAAAMWAAANTDGPRCRKRAEVKEETGCRENKSEGPSRGKSGC